VESTNNDILSTRVISLRFNYRFRQFRLNSAEKQFVAQAAIPRENTKKISL